MLLTNMVHLVLHVQPAMVVAAETTYVIKVGQTCRSSLKANTFSDPVSHFTLSCCLAAILTLISLYMLVYNLLFLFKANPQYSFYR